MGLNRREVLERTYLEQHARDLAVRIFWSIYLLDMRASCGTGIPFVIQDVDIDSTLPEPVSVSHHLADNTDESEIGAYYPHLPQDDDKLRSPVQKSLEGRELIHKSREQADR